LRLLAASIALASTALASVNPVVIQGQEFVDSVTKDRVMIIGVEYGDIVFPKVYRVANKCQLSTGRIFCL
jgi:hypothetical protein